MLSAQQLNQRGREASNAGRHGEARRLLRRALARPADPDTRARTLLTLAHVDAERGSRDDGLALCTEAMALRGVSARVRGLVHAQRALLLMRSGLGREAIEAFHTAEGLLGDDRGERARLLLNRGNVYLQHGDTKRAADDFARSIELAESAEVRAKAEGNLGYTRLLHGDLVTALQLIDQAREQLDPISPFLRAVGELDRAEVLVASGMTREAAHAMASAAEAFGSVKARQSQAEAELVLSRMLLMTDPSRSRKVARRASRRFARRGSTVWALRAEGVALAAAAQAGRASLDTARELDGAARALARHGLRRESTLLRLYAARMRIRAGDLAEARRTLSRVRPGESTPLTTRLLNREVRAELAVASGRPKDAAGHVRSGLTDLHAWQSSFGSLDLQSSLVGHGRALALRGLSLAVEDGRPEVLFEWSERARALATRVSPLRPPSDAAVAADLSELRVLQTEINEAETSGASPRTLTAQANRLRSQIRERSWYGEGSGVVTEPVRLEEVIATLGATDGALVSYLVVDGQVRALVAADGAAHVVDLGRFSDVAAYLDGMQADLDMAAARLPDLMRTAVLAALDKRLSLLGDILVEPIRRRLGDRPLVIVPSAALAGTPWSLLPGLAGRALTVPRSGTSWIADRARWERPRRAGFVAGPRVDRAVEEVNLAARAWPGATVLTGTDAMTERVHELASRSEVFHVAAHGRHSAENPLFSGLEICDGPWFGYDIDRLETIPSTVILSACEVGRSTVRWGEETLGMTVAWLHAGAHCVIASPASVNDDAACELLAATHTRLAAGARPSEALAAAAGDVDAESPASFICFGAGW